MTFQSIETNLSSTSAIQPREATGRISMRVGIMTCIHSFDPGGVERVALRLCNEWRRQGVSVTVAVGRDSGAMRPDAPALDYRVAPSGRLPVAAFETLWMIWWLSRTVRRVRPDVLFMPGNTYAVVAAAMRLLLGRDCPPILLKVSNDLTRAQSGRVGRRLYSCWCRLQGRLIDRFAALAEPMRTQIATVMAADPRRISLIPNPVLTAEEQIAFAAAGNRARESRGRGRRYLAAGRLVPQKNFALLLEAFSAAAWPEDRLVIVGEGPERGPLEAAIARLGLGAHVRLAGYQASLAEWLADADIFVLSSDYEGLPSVVVEALAAGLPVVATDCCVSMDTLLDGGKLGRLVPTGDRTALAAAMALTEPGSISRAGARRRVAQFGSARAAATYLDAFSDMVTKGNRNRRAA